MPTNIPGSKRGLEGIGRQAKLNKKTASRGDKIIAEKSEREPMSRLFILPAEGSMVYFYAPFTTLAQANYTLLNILD